MTQTIKITKAAMAVLEEMRHGDSWSNPPIEIPEGYQIVVQDAVYNRLAELAAPMENYSSVIVRLYREGKL